MGWDFNPFVGNFDKVIAGPGSGWLWDADLLPSGDNLWDIGSGALRAQDFHSRGMSLTQGPDLTGFGTWQLMRFPGPSGTVVREIAVEDSGNYSVQDLMDGPPAGTINYSQWITSDPNAGTNYRSAFWETNIVDGGDSSFFLLGESWGAAATGHCQLQADFGAAVATWDLQAHNNTVGSGVSHFKEFGIDQSALSLTDVRWLWQLGSTNLMALGKAGDLSLARDVEVDSDTYGLVLGDTQRTRLYQDGTHTNFANLVGTGRVQFGMAVSPTLHNTYNFGTTTNRFATHFGYWASFGNKTTLATCSQRKQFQAIYQATYSDGLGVDAFYVELEDLSPSATLAHNAARVKIVPHAANLSTALLLEANLAGVPDTGSAVIRFMDASYTNDRGLVTNGAWIECANLSIQGAPNDVNCIGLNIYASGSPDPKAINIDAGDILLTGPSDLRFMDAASRISFNDGPVYMQWDGTNWLFSSAGFNFTGPVRSKLVFNDNIPAVFSTGEHFSVYGDAFDFYIAGDSSSLTYRFGSGTGNATIYGRGADYANWTSWDNIGWQTYNNVWITYATLAISNLGTTPSANDQIIIASEYSAPTGYCNAINATVRATGTTETANYLQGTAATVAIYDGAVNAGRCFSGYYGSTVGAGYYGNQNITWASTPFFRGGLFTGGYFGTGKLVGAGNVQFGGAQFVAAVTSDCTSAMTIDALVGGFYQVYVPNALTNITITDSYAMLVGMNLVANQTRVYGMLIPAYSGTAPGTIWGINSAYDIQVYSGTYIYWEGTQTTKGTARMRYNAGATEFYSNGDLDLTCGANKTLELQNVVYDDFVVPISSIMLSGAQPPTATSYKSGMVLAFPTTADKTIYFVAQLPHRYKEGTDIVLHIHWTIKTSGAGGGAENVKWNATYSACSPLTGSWPAASTATATRDVQADTADEHMVDNIVTITGTAFKISEVLICSLTRDVSVASDYGDDAYLVSVDFHYQIDTMGSRQITAK